jgi:hypothetical protein
MRFPRVGIRVVGNPHRVVGICRFGLERKSVRYPGTPFFSLRHLPLLVLRRSIGFSNLEIIPYFTVSALLCIFSIVVGVQSRELSIVGAEIMRVCHILALMGIVVPAIAFPFRTPAHFSFGVTRFDVVCSFAFTVLLCFISSSLVIELVESLIIFHRQSVCGRVFQISELSYSRHYKEGS